MKSIGSIDPMSYFQGQSAATSRASVAESEASAARVQAQIAGEQVDQTLAALGMLRKQVDAWKARYEREKATRRGWQQNGKAARELIQKLANVDQAGAQKMIDEAYERNKSSIDASVAGVDQWNFTGVKPGTSQ